MAQAKTTTIKLTATEISLLVEGLSDRDFGENDKVADRLFERLLQANRRLAEKE